ncbi:MAG TPA: oligosaccharide flippase family protein [Azospirillaceae bacterium]|nr:oligosaccharide flippase family protein [Azospirillaceae bacterium]
MNGLRRSLVLSFSDRYATLVINFALTALLARLLSPAEVGTYVVAATLVALVNTFREFGVTTYLIQKQTVSDDCVRTAFTVNLALSALFSLALVAGGDWVAAFYGEDGLGQAITVHALGFLLSPIPITVVALLRRDMAFGGVALCNVAGALAAAAVSVALACLGFGFMGPVWGTVAGTVATTAVALLLFPHSRLFRPSLEAWRDVLGFGGYSSATALINVFYQSSPQLILGRVLDFASVGLYSRAMMISQLFDKLVIDALQPVIMPAVSAAARAGADLKVIYLRALEHLTAVHWPALIFLALMADPIVALMFGRQWVAIVPLVRLLAVAALALSPACLTYPILVTLGRIRDTFVSSMISVPVSLAVLVAASFFGLGSVAASALVIAPFQVTVALLYVRRQIAFTVSDLLAATWRSAVVTLGSVAGPAAVVLWVGLDASLAALAVAGLLAAAGWTGTLFAVHHPLAQELLHLTGRAWSRFPLSSPKEGIKEPAAPSIG